MKHSIVRLDLPGEPAEVVTEWIVRSGVTPLPSSTRMHCVSRVCLPTMPTRSTDYSTPRRSSKAFRY